MFYFTRLWGIVACSVLKEAVQCVLQKFRSSVADRQTDRHAHTHTHTHTHTHVTKTQFCLIHCYHVIVNSVGIHHGNMLKSPVTIIISRVTNSVGPHGKVRKPKLMQLKTREKIWTKMKVNGPWW